MKPLNKLAEKLAEELAKPHKDGDIIQVDNDETYIRFRFDSAWFEPPKLNAVIVDSMVRIPIKP